MKNLFIQLSCAFSTTDFNHKAYVNDGRKRDKQYRNGLKNFFSFYSKYSNSYEDIYIVDNTVENKSKLDPKILEYVPNNVNYIFSNENTYGKNNKGSGCIEQWIACKDILSKYKLLKK